MAPQPAASNPTDAATNREAREPWMDQPTQRLTAVEPPSDPARVDAGALELAHPAPSLHPEASSSEPPRRVVPVPRRLIEEDGDG